VSGVSDLWFTPSITFIDGVNHKSLTPDPKKVIDGVNHKSLTPDPKEFNNRVKGSGVSDLWFTPSITFLGSGVRDYGLLHQ
jgi:hypothetical protein